MQRFKYLLIEVIDVSNSPTNVRKQWGIMTKLSKIKKNIVEPSDKTAKSLNKYDIYVFGEASTECYWEDKDGHHYRYEIFNPKMKPSQNPYA